MAERETLTTEIVKWPDAARPVPVAAGPGPRGVTGVHHGWAGSSENLQLCSVDEFPS